MAPRIVIAVLLLGFALAWILRKLTRSWERFERSRIATERMARASYGERRAAALLEGAGYTVVGAQVPARYALYVDGEPRTFDVRADYIVERRGRSYVAEVKTGALAPRLEVPATRRQLLEYALAFDCAGVLLVDAETKRIHTIDLPDSFAGARTRKTKASWSAATIFVGCVAIGTAVGLLR